MAVPNVKFNNGKEVPIIGLGTWGVSRISSDCTTLYIIPLANQCNCVCEFCFPQSGSFPLPTISRFLPSSFCTDARIHIGDKKWTRVALLIVCRLYFAGQSVCTYICTY